MKAKELSDILLSNPDMDVRVAITELKETPYTIEEKISDSQTASSITVDLTNKSIIITGINSKYR